MSRKIVILALAAPLLASGTLIAATVGGVVFADYDRDGVHDAGEPPIRNVQVFLRGLADAVALSDRTDAAGAYSFAGVANGQYTLTILRPDSVRGTFPQRTADPAPVPNLPFGRSRFSLMDRLGPTLWQRRAGGQFRHIGLGDSIAFGFNLCGSITGSGGYLEPTTARLNASSGANVVLDKQAVLGHETPDLLIPGTDPDSSGRENDVFYVIDEQPDLVTVSIGGNDFLGAEDSGDAAIAAALVAARQNLQEILSALVTGVPQADFEINTVYDNHEGEDATHNAWAGIWNQMLREAAWAQRRRVTIAEVYPEYAHDENSTTLGQPGLICQGILNLDGIHPTNAGYDVHEEKLWQSMGGITVAGSDLTDIDLGYLRRTAKTSASAHNALTGNITDPEGAMAPGGASAIVGSDDQELRVSDFLPIAPPGNQDLLQAVLIVRYRTTGAPVDDTYRFEASVDGSFSTPGSTTTTWNTILPVVGGAGILGGEPLAFPDVPSFRQVSAPIYAGSPVDGSPTLTWTDLDTLTVRLVTTAVGAPDAYSVEWDGAQLEVFAGPAGSARIERTLLEGGPISAPLSRTSEELRDSVRSAPTLGARVEAAAALLERDDAIGIDLLLTGLDVAAAPRRLRQALATPAALPGLRRAALDHNPHVRRAAAWALGRIRVDPASDLPILRTLLRDPDSSVRMAAAGSLASLGDRASAPEIATLSLRHDGAGWISSLEALDTEETVAALARLASSPRPSVRWLASRALARSQHPDAHGVLKELADSSDPRVRRMAEAGLQSNDTLGR